MDLIKMKFISCNILKVIFAFALFGAPRASLLASFNVLLTTHFKEEMASCYFFLWGSYFTTGYKVNSVDLRHSDGCTWGRKMVVFKFRILFCRLGEKPDKLEVAVVPASRNETIISGLQPYTSYYVYVAARNDVGPSKFSLPSKLVKTREARKYYLLTYSPFLSRESCSLTSALTVTYIVYRSVCVCLNVCLHLILYILKRT